MTPLQVGHHSQLHLHAVGKGGRLCDHRVQPGDADGIHGEGDLFNRKIPLRKGHTQKIKSIVL